MSGLKVSVLTQENAETIAGWPFPADYPWTALGKGSENEYYLLHSVFRGDHYFQIADGERLLGYFSVNDRIRKEVAGLQIVIHPGESEETEKAFIQTVLDFVKEHHPVAERVNVMAYSSGPRAVRIYEQLGFTSHGVLSSFAHDMSSYEQDGFNVDESGKRVEEIALTILDRAVR